MSSLEERRRVAEAGIPADQTDGALGFGPTRVFLQPIAAPSILGLMGFSVSTMMVALIQSGLIGTWTDMGVVGFFCLTFGGVAQFLAGMWAYRARDGVATLAHGMWGSFWIAFGILQILTLAGVVAAPKPGATVMPLALWFLGLAYGTWIAAFAALFENLGVFAVLTSLAIGASLTSIAWFENGIGSTWMGAGGYAFIVSAALAAYVVMAMLFVGVTGRAILPTGELKKAANTPGGKIRRPIELEWAEPGVRQGQ